MNPLQILWKDKMDIYRFTSETVNGITKSRKKLIQSEVKCKYSKGSLSEAETGAPLLSNKYTLFCGVEVDIKEGDEIELTQANGRVVKLTVGEGFPYTYHQEFLVVRSDYL